MEIRYVSDLHLEMLVFNYQDRKLDTFLSKVLPVTEKDKDRALVLAGDLFRVDSPTMKKNAISFLDYCSSNFKYVVYIPGNHEYYGMSIKDTDNLLLKLCSEYSNVYNLDKIKFLNIDTEVFVGGVLWSDVLCKGPIIEALIHRSISDYSYIRKFTTTDCAELHREYVSKLNSIARIPIPEEHNLIVVTHHLPSFKSVSPIYKDSDINPAFVSSLDYLVKKLSADVWIHGHSHSSCTYKIGRTQVVANPFGYDFKENLQFLKEAVIRL